MLKKVNSLLEEILDTPFSGVGKPEALKHELSGYWSRRITAEHRLVYKIEGKKGVDQKCYIIQCRFRKAFTQMGKQRTVCRQPLIECTELFDATKM